MLPCSVNKFINRLYLDFRMRNIKRKIIFLKNAKTKYIAIFSLIIILYLCGIFSMILETKFDNFTYSLDTDVVSLVKAIRQNRSPDVAPINLYNFSFIMECKNKCYEEEPIKVVYLIKSATSNFNRRKAIRRTWGFEARFSDVLIKRVFILGKHNNDKEQENIEREIKEFNDVVQADFVDEYFNNTVKTMMAIKWAISYCNNAKFYFFCDDDYYVSTKNLLAFLKNPADYPGYLQVPIGFVRQAQLNQLGRSLKTNRSDHILQTIDFELPDDIELYAGYLFDKSKPLRQKWSKWYISLSEYPFSFYPPYISAGAYVLSREALHQMYYASLFVQHFRFDDIYMGILAYKMNIKPMHNDEFYFYKKEYNIFNYRYVVASHGYSDPVELENVWNQQKSIGNA